MALIEYEVREETLLYSNITKELLILTDSIVAFENACIIMIWQSNQTKQIKPTYR